MTEQKTSRSVTLPIPPMWLVMQVLLVVLVGGLLWADREYWNEFVADPNELESDRESLTSIEADVERLADDLEGLDNDVRSVRRTANAALSANTSTNSELFDHPELAIMRIANSLAVIALVQNAGGAQSSGSPQGQACVAYFLRGEGSFVECGFTRVEQ